MDYSSTGGMRSPFSPRVRQSLSGRRTTGLSSVKKNVSKYEQSPQQQTGDVIYKTARNTIETYGTPLPVMVTEALTFGSGDVSVRMSPCGWCWVVSGRRVLAWPYDADSSTGPAAARELILPQTDLAHKADLVLIFYEDNDQSMPSCVGVSPEGVVRYWGSVGAEGAYSEGSCELAGQECDRLELSRAPHSLLLATTTCTLVKITTSREGRPTVNCQTMRPPSGWLGGIGRRVSHLFFGSMPAHADTKLVGVVILPGGGEGGEGEEGGEETVCLVAGGPLLQTWRGAALHEHHLRRALLDAAAHLHLAPHGGEPSTVEVSALAVCAGARGRSLLLLLACCTLGAARSDLRYALAEISVERVEAPSVVGVVGVAGAVGGAARLLPLPPPRALLYSPAAIAFVPTQPSCSEKAEYVEVSAEGDRVLGAAGAGGGSAPLLFTAKHGLLAVRAAPHTDTQSFSASPMGSPTPSEVYDGNLTLYEIDPNEVNAAATDACGKLKAAFLYHVRRDASAGRLLADAFPPRAADVDAPLDRAVLALAAEMLDDVPAGDPRWRIRSGHSRAPLGSSAALHAHAQLRDKHRVLTLFVEFLRAQGLWRRLGRVSREAGGGCWSTARALGSLAERLAAARALQRLAAAGAAAVEAALQAAAAAGEAGGEEEAEVAGAWRAGALSAAEVVLRRVTRVWRAVRALLSLPAPAPDAPPAAAHTHNTLLALTTILSETQKVRSQWSSWCEGAEEAPPCAELPALVAYHTAAITEYAHSCRDATWRARVLEAGGALADLLLAEARALPPHRYRDLRLQLIRPYVEEGETERAAALAEKFKEFELLVEMCVRHQRTERLLAYIDKYENEGMAETTFAWLASRGGPERALLLRAVGGARLARLARWLAAAPDRRELLALHRLARTPHPDAAAALLDMAADERDSLDRQATAASLAKLCLAAAEDGPPEELWARAEGTLSVAALQRALPRDLLLHYGQDAASMKPLTPEELVQMYVEYESPSLTEYDYKKALDLADFVEDPDLREDLVLKVWGACIAREDWSAVSVQSAASSVQHTLLYRLLDLLNLMGAEVSRVPPLERVVAGGEAARAAQDPRVLYLLKYTYSCLTDHDHDRDHDHDHDMEQPYAPVPPTPSA